MNFNQIERLYQTISKKEKHIQCFYNPKFIRVKSKDKKHVYMGELKKDRKIDLKTFGQDLFINIASDEEKFLRDLKIYTKTGFKHHFNAFHELVDSPDKIKNICKSINRINITDDEFLILSERRGSAAIKQLQENKIIPKECDVTSPMNLKARRPMKTVKLSNQLNNNKLFARLKSIDQELNCFSSTRKSVAQNLEGNKNDTISQKIDISNNPANLKYQLRIKSPRNEAETKTLQLPCVVFHIPKDCYEYFKPGTIVDILIKDVSEKTLKSQKITNERVQTNPALSNNSLIINIPLDPCRWIGSVKNLENKTLRISVTPKRMNSNKSIVQYFHFGYINSVDLNKTQPEIAKQLLILKVFLEHIRYIEFNEDKSNNILAKHFEIKLSEAKKY